MSISFPKSLRALLAALALPSLLVTAPELAAQGSKPHDAKGMHATAGHVQNTDAAGLAVKGYDVVAYQAQGTATVGSTAFVATHEGATYRFASAANRDAFVAEPARYLPQYGGYCAMGVAFGRKFDVDPTAFRVVDGKLYLNKDAATQRMWQKDVPGHVKKADGQWAKVALRSLDG